MSDNTGAPGDPYPIELNRGFSGIAIAIQATATSGQVQYTTANLTSAIQSQYPLLSVNPDPATNLVQCQLSKVEIWGPSAGIVSMTPYQRVLDNFSSFSGVVAYSATRLDVGTATRRPYVSFTWPDENKNLYAFWTNENDPMFNFTATSGGTAFGTYCILYLHFHLKAPQAVGVPSLYLEGHTDEDEETRKRKIDRINDEAEKAIKVAKIKSITLPDMFKE